MYSWSTDEEELKNDPDYYQQWKLEQLINFGLGGKKLSEALLKRYWGKLQIDPLRKRFLSILVHGNDYSGEKPD